MKYTIEATDAGYRFGWETATRSVTIEEKGGHGDLEKLYAQAEQLINRLRGEITTHKEFVAKPAPTAPKRRRSRPKNQASRPGRPKGSQTGFRDQQVLDLIAATPGIRGGELSEALGIGTHIYRILSRLQKSGQVEKKFMAERRGTGYFVKEKV